MELSKVVERRVHSRAGVAQQILCLVAQLIEIGTRREPTREHTSLLQVPVVRSFGPRRFVRRTGR
jgi:hypothetical protein